MIIKYSDNIHGFTGIMKNKPKGNEPNLVNEHKYKTEHISPLQLSWSSILSGYFGFFLELSQTLVGEVTLSTDCFSQRFRLPDTSPGLKSEGLGAGDLFASGVLVSHSLMRLETPTFKPAVSLFGVPDAVGDENTLPFSHMLLMLRTPSAGTGRSEAAGFVGFVVFVPSIALVYCSSLLSILETTAA